MSRIQSREYALKVIFSKLFTLNKMEEKEQMELEMDEEFNQISDVKDLEYTAKVLFAYAHNFDEINKKISENLQNYTIEKLFKLDLAIISVAVTELYHIEDTPIQIIINEAVNLAKKYSTDKSYKFVNGFLANLIKKYPPKIVDLDKPIEKNDDIKEVKEKEPVVKKNTASKTRQNKNVRKNI